ncbi:hypothetical protein AFLA70_124g001791 [Aspergillus flavus AF70]|nr:hypothetical protein AFLA70_124g001791 [Aspergillus flavus AF70]
MPRSLRSSVVRLRISLDGVKRLRAHLIMPYPKVKARLECSSTYAAGWRFTQGWGWCLNCSRLSRSDTE